MLSIKCPELGEPRDELVEEDDENRSQRQDHPEIEGRQKPPREEEDSFDSHF
jgi:hypothetical protein